jgi:uncharacterized protein YndB with AHSA1/START domain
MVTAVVRADPAVTFAAFTDQIDEWWRRPAAVRDAVVQFVGERLVAVSSSGTDVLGTVTAWEPPHRVALDWHGPHAEPGDAVTIVFEPEAGGTRVTVRHSRAGLPEDAVEQATIGKWWGDLLQRLQRRIER